MTTEEKMVEKQHSTDKINDSDIMREAGKLDEVGKEALLICLTALAKGKPQDEVLEETNKYLMMRGRKPIPPMKEEKKLNYLEAAMTNRDRMIEKFCSAYPEYIKCRESLDLNLWCDILQGGVIIAESNLHGAPVEKLGNRLPDSWKLC